jgi:hypothetical protein
VGEHEQSPASEFDANLSLNHTANPQGAQEFSATALDRDYRISISNIDT